MATNFLNTAGTNGLIQAQFSLMTTELNTLGSGAAATSSVAGPFTQTNWANAIWGGIQFKAGGAFTPVSGQTLLGWFLISEDGGSTYEALLSTPSTTVPALGRSPDFVIPLYEGGAAWASGSIRAIQSRYVKTAWETHKVVLQNFGASAVALPASGNVLSGTGVAIQY